MMKLLLEERIIAIDDIDQNFTETKYLRTCFPTSKQSARNDEVISEVLNFIVAIVTNASLVTVIGAGYWA